MTWPRLGRTRRWAADCRPQGWSPAVVRGDGDACRCVPLPDMSCLPGSISGASFLSRHTPRRGESSASNNLNHDRSGRFAVPKARFRGVQKTRHGPATPSGRRAPPSQPYGLPQMGGPSRSSILPCQLVLWERRPVPCAADRREGILQSRKNSFSCRRGTEGPKGGGVFANREFSPTNPAKRQAAPPESAIPVSLSHPWPWARRESGPQRLKRRQSGNQVAPPARLKHESQTGSVKRRGQVE